MHKSESAFQSIFAIIRPILCIFFIWNSSISCSAVNPENYHNDNLERISKDKQWLRLLHYKKTLNSSDFTSQVDDRNFFNAQDGKSNSRSELRATIDSLNKNNKPINQQSICRFPARWAYLQKQLALPPDMVAINQCTELNQWLNALKPHSITLVLASSYLNSPSSMFGHTFLRIDPDNIEQGSTWLSYAVNFGAELNTKDNSIIYAYKGLFGGYPGFFSVIKYYEKIKEYGRIENRDLWEYKLNLTPEESYYLALHLWELRNINFDYYFFDENCSYRLLELLEVARPGLKLHEKFKMRAIPVDTIRAVVDEDLIDSIQYRPSAATKIEFKVQQLNKKEQNIAKQIALQNLSLTDSKFISLPPQQQSKIISLAYDYLRYKELDHSRNNEKAAFSLELLKKLNSLPNSSKKNTIPIPNITPDQGHQTLLGGITLGTQDHIGFSDLRFRMSYHDLLDNPSGYLDGAAINIGELQLRQFKNDSLQIEMFNLVDINSHSPRSLFFSPITWRIRAGVERIYSNLDDDLVTQINGGAGVTYSPTSSMLLYSLVTARLEYNELLDHNWAFGPGALAGLLIYFPIGTLSIETQYSHLTDNDKRTIGQLNYNLPIGKNNAIRFSLNHKKQLDIALDEVKLEFRHYF